MATPITFFIKVDFNKSPNSITKSLQEFLPIYYMLEETKSLFKQLQDQDIDQKSLNIPITGKSTFEAQEEGFHINPDKFSAKP